MKKFIVFAIAAVLSVAMLVSLMAFNLNEKDPNQGYILVEIYEIPSYPDRGVHIHYGGNKREFIPFTGMELEHHDEAGDITLAAINKLVAEGYEIESTSAGLDQAGMITKIFMRKK
ncbi:MAG TPA: hypothetical protein VEB86_14445 [Chryseosolibacter sp.]|nr:hypothetical protein [Chryseosolibacter sp.]